VGEGGRGVVVAESCLFCRAEAIIFEGPTHENDKNRVDAHGKQKEIPVHRVSSNTRSSYPKMTHSLARNALDVVQVDLD
jgi:hypothetical protein